MTHSHHTKIISTRSARSKKQRPDQIKSGSLKDLPSSKNQSKAIAKAISTLKGDISPKTSYKQRHVRVKNAEDKDFAAERKSKPFIKKRQHIIDKGDVRGFETSALKRGERFSKARPSSKSALQSEAWGQEAVSYQGPEGLKTNLRLAKILARAGVASRRQAERYISEGRVKLNGKLITGPLLDKEEPGKSGLSAKDQLTLDGVAITGQEPSRLWLYHKPVGLLTTHQDPKGRPTVFQYLPKVLPRVVSVGRLDLASEGLLLLTNDGELANQLAKPENGWVRHYRVRALGQVTKAQLESLAKGIRIAGVHYGPIFATHARKSDGERGDGRLRRSANIWLDVNLTEGKNREIRNVLSHLGLRVNRLIRLSYGPFYLETLPSGAVVEVASSHVRALMRGEMELAKLPKQHKARIFLPDKPLPPKFPNKGKRGEASEDKIESATKTRPYFPAKNKQLKSS